jgi:hypothetical protein
MRKARKVTLPKPLRLLTNEQLAEIHSWFNRRTYGEMCLEISRRFAVSVSIYQLHRYYQKYAAAQLHSAAQVQPLSPADIIAIENAQPIPDHVNKRVLKEHCLRILKSRRDITVTELTHLFQVVTYDERRALDEKSNAVKQMGFDVRDRRLAYLRELRDLSLSQQQLNATNVESP